MILPYEEYIKLIEQSANKETIQVGSFNKFVGILDNNFETDDVKYNNIVS